MALVKKLTKIGNSYGVILSTDILKLAGMAPDGEFEIDADEKGIVLRPHFSKTPTDKKVSQAVERFIKKYRKDLQNLA